MSNTNAIREIVVYRIKKDKVSSFPNEGRNELKDFVKDCKGLESYNTLQSTKDETVFADIVIWNSLEEAEQAAAQMDVKLKAGEMPHFAASFDKVEFFNHFKLIS